MKKYNFLLLAFLAHCSLFAQREYNVCDSSSFTLNNDTTIVAGKRNLYVHTNSTLSPLYDFTTTDTNEYIRDFDIVKPDLWFTVVGSRYIGGLTQLYRSSDRGQTWDIDSAHYNASNAQSVSFNFLRSINNLQHINGDTLIMFMHYYESGIIYSTDAGSTWTKWFDNLIVHYQGMLSCNDKYYLYSFEGDAFRPWMFGFLKTLLFSPDTNSAWNSFSNLSNHPMCSTANDTVNCVYASTSNTRCGQYTHFKNYIDSICLTSDINTFEIDRFEVFPNPVTEFLTVRSHSAEFCVILIYNILGGKMMNTSISKNDSEYLLDVRDHPNGLYTLQINDRGNFYQKKYIKK
jgi:hypothetical protein